MRKDRLEYTSPEAMKEFEVPSNVSKQYVPIYSTDIIAALEPEFQFTYAMKFFPKQSRHYFEMESDKGKIRVYNSYDRSLALRIAYVADIPVDLGVNHLIHRGASAQTFNDNLHELKPLILKAIDSAQLLSNALANTKVTKNLAKEISVIVFAKVIEKEGFQEYKNYTDLLGEMSVTTYIKTTMKNYLEGNYTYVVSGNKKNGRVLRSALLKMQIEAKIMDFIAEDHVEFLL